MKKRQVASLLVQRCAEPKNVGTARFYRVETAALLRRVMSVNGEYLKAGWSREQIGNYVGDNI